MTINGKVDCELLTLLPKTLRTLRPMCSEPVSSYTTGGSSISKRALIAAFSAASRSPRSSSASQSCHCSLGLE
jgi:hypothetical protein